MPLQMIVLPLVAIGSHAVAGDASFGPPQTMLCIWFSNFENSRFERCAVGRRTIIADGAIPVFATGVAQRFDREARRIAGRSVDSVPRGTFEVSIIGRRGLTRREHSRYLGDARQDVKVERLIAMRLVSERD